MVASVKQFGGYARRIEDQYAVGVFDMIMIPFGLPVFLAEVKIIKGVSFGPTERQFIELTRVITASNQKGHAIPVMIGWKEGTFYFHKPAEVIQCRDCFSVTTSDLPFNTQLVQFYHSQKGTT
jgi:hypothetical protein